MFKYLGWPLDRSDNDWPVVLRNIRKARLVWDCLGKIMRREGEETDASEKFYHVVIQAVLLFGAKTWVLSPPMAQSLEGVHVGLLRQVKNLKAKSMEEGLWQKVAADRVLQGAGTQPLQTYLERRQAKVAEWVALRPIFEVCER